MLQRPPASGRAAAEAGRSDAISATSEYTSLMRRNFELLKNLIYPLLEQSTTPEDEQNSPPASTCSASRTPRRTAPKNT